MTRIAFATLLSLFLTLAFHAGVDSAHGQLQDVSQNRFQVYVASGPSLPYGTSDFTDQYQRGYTFTGGFGITLTPEWELSFSGSYSQFSLDQDGYRSAIGSARGTFDGEVVVYSGKMSLKYLFVTEGAWVPYFVAGMGAYHRGESDIRTTIVGNTYTSATRASKTLAGGHVGFGLAYRITQAMSLYVEPRYTSTASTETAYDTLDYAMVQLGLIVSPF